MTFATPPLLWLLLAPTLWLGWEFVWRTRAVGSVHPKILRAEADAHAVRLSTFVSQASAYAVGARPRWRLALGLACAVVALARPQWGRIEEPVVEQACDILIALDLSRSMLAPDVKPTRLERARLLVTSLLEKLHGERVGLVVFSGTAFLQSPLSGDYEILREFLPALGPDYLPEGGTNFSALADTALAAFGPGGSADRFLIVLSDGEANDDGWRARLDELKAKGVRVIGLGVGTDEGAMLPDGTGQFVKDERGAVVLSKLDRSTLRALADATGGTYADASGWVDLAQLLQATVERGQRGVFRSAGRVRLSERFQWVLAPALLLLVWSFWREFPVRPRPRALVLRVPPAASGPTPSVSPAAATGLALLILTSGLWLPAALFAVVTRTDTDSKATSPLPQLVARLAGSPDVRAADWANLATATLTWGNALKSGQKPVAAGPVHDGLAAVELGAKLDAKAADWHALRTSLEQLLEQSDEQKSPPPDQSNQPQQQNQKSDQPDQNETKNQPPGGESQPKDPSASSTTPNDPASSAQPPPTAPPEKSDAPNPSDQKSPENLPPRPGQQSLGDLKPADRPPPSSAPPPGEMQQVGGMPTQTVATTSTDPLLTVPLQKLDQLRESDSPVRLYQLMQQAENPSAPDATAKKHNW